MNKIEPGEPILLETLGNSAGNLDGNVTSRENVPMENVPGIPAGNSSQSEKWQARARKRLKKIAELRAEMQKPAKRPNEPKKTKQRARKGIPRRKPNEIQPFVEKILNIIEDGGYQSIFWNENGTRFVIDREHFEV